MRARANSYILGYLQDIFGDNLLNPDLQIAFSQGRNKRLALIGDSILNLVVKLEKYEEPNFKPESIDDARKQNANKKIMQDILNQDKTFTEYLKKEHKCSSPVGNIGLERADDYMEAIIGAIFLRKRYARARLPYPETRCRGAAGGRGSLEDVGGLWAQMNDRDGFLRV